MVDKPTYEELENVAAAAPLSFMHITFFGKFAILFPISGLKNK